MSRGQHVEVIDTSPSNGTPDFYLIRHLVGDSAANSQSGAGAGNGLQQQPISEGLVPASALRPVSNLKASNSGGVYANPPENEGKSTLLSIWFEPYFSAASKRFAS